MTAAQQVIGGQTLELVSVVVCTAGRRDSIWSLLESATRLADPAYEVIVVENTVHPALDPARLARLGVRHVIERRPGLDAARNRGAQEAHGTIVAFVDDDCGLDPGWLTALRAGFSERDVGLVTGRVLPATLERPSQQLFEAWCSWDRGAEQVRYVVSDRLPGFPAAAHHLGTGCNMAFRAAVLLELGGFDEALDMGTLVGGGGDLDMFVRTLDAGYAAVYEPDALVHHTHRQTMHDLRWQVWGYGLSQGALLAKGLMTRPGLRGEIVRFGRQRLRDKASELRHRSAAGVPRRLLALEVAGILLGPLAYAVSVARLRWRQARA